MNNIEILLDDYGIIDIDDTNIPLIFTIDKVSDVGIRRSSFSKTIKIPGTKKNNKIFENIWEIKRGNYVYASMLTKKHPCTILYNKSTLLKGVMRIKDIEKQRDDSGAELIYYNVQINDQIKNIFDEIGDDKLIDLDFSSGFTFNGNVYDTGDHIFSLDNILLSNSSSTRDYTNVWEYPLVDYGYQILPSGSTNVRRRSSAYPYHTYLGFGSFDIYTSISQFYPAIYHKAIIDKIFYDVGWTYDSDFLSGNTYDGIFNYYLNIYNGQQHLTNVHLIAYYTNATISYDLDEAPQDVYPNISILKYRIDAGIKKEVNTPSLEYTYFNIPKDGNYTINLSLNIALDKGGSSIDGCPLPTPTNYYLKKTEGTPSDDPDDDENLWIINTYQLDPSVSGDTYLENKFYENSISGLTLNENESVYLYIKRGYQSYDEDPGCVAEYCEFILTGVTMELLREIEDDEFEDKKDKLIQISDYLPDMKQTEFIKNLIKLNNLYLIQEDSNKEKIKIEPHDDFFIDDIVDWTNKVDYSKKIVVEPNEQAKKYIFNYSEGEDTDNINFLDKYDQVYGSKIIDNNLTILSAIVKGEEVLEVDWQPLMLNNFFEVYNLDPGNEELLIPKKLSDDNEWFHNIQSSKPLIGLSALFSKTGVDVNYGDNTKILNSIRMASHIKYWGGYWYDINFYTDQSKISYDIGTTNYSEIRDIYKTYYLNYILNKTNTLQRKVTYYINLNYSDILNLNFRKTFIIDGQQYFLNRVEYDPSNNDSSKVTLIKKKVGT